VSRRRLSLGKTVVLFALVVATGGCGTSEQGRPAELRVHFVMPGRDIECEMNDPSLTNGNVLCAIHRKRFRDTDYGDGEKPSRRWLLELTRFPAVFSNGRGFGSPIRVLRYGRTLRVGFYRCTSRATGLTCISRRSGHGFVLSNTRQRRF
jgi:hypothetical protein